MPQEDNLIPFDQRSPEERRELGSKGGKASGEARRRKRSMREAAEAYLSLPVTDGRARNRLVRKGLKANEIDNQMAMIVGLTTAATAGDARAAKALIDLIGGSAAQEDDGEVQIIDDL